MEIAVKQLKTDHPKIYAEVFEQGRAAGKERFAELLKVCGNDHKLLTESFLADTNINEITEARIKSLEKSNAELAQSLENREARSLTDTELKMRFGESQKLQDEFSNAQAYIAYARHTKDVTSDRL